MGEPPSSCLTQLTFMELPLGSSSPSTLGGFGFPAATQKQDGAELKACFQGDSTVQIFCESFVTHNSIMEINWQPRTN